MNKVYLLLGSNLGGREKFLSLAEKEIEKQIGKIISASSVYETAAWGKEDQDAFLNKVICVETNLKAEKVLEKILSIEKNLGRTRDKKWEARIIDIDILFFNSEIFKSSNLQIPHPHLHERRFALVPLAEIAPEFVHPVLKKTVKELLNECPDELKVERL